MIKKEKEVSFKKVKITFYDSRTWQSTFDIVSGTHSTKEIVPVSKLRARGLEIVKKHYPDQNMFTVKFGSSSDSPIYFYQL